MYRRNRYNRRTCGCQQNERCNCPNCAMPPFMPRNPLLANAYVPYQELDETFSPEESLCHGTTFPELVSPYMKNQSQCIVKYLSETKTCREVDDCE